MTGLTGQTIAGCEIISELGHGGMGAVYKARQSSLNRLVAVKVMSAQLADDADYITRFKREAAVAAQLHHQNMVLVHSAGEENGLCYIVMEFVEGRSLHDHIERHGRLAPREALAITIHIAQALQYAWNKSKLIHRDIKPANIFLSNEGEVKVGDLGLAKSVGQSTAGLTQTGTAMGSPLYIAPEQARGIKEIDFRADIYSLGCTLYHMLTGQTPYSGTDAVSIIHKHIFDPPPAIFKVWPQCPMPLGMLVGKMLAKQPNARHQSYEDLIADLYAVTEKIEAASVQATAALPQPAADVAAIVPSATPAKTPPRSQPRTATPKPAKSRVESRMPKAGIAAGVVALAVLIGGLLLWSPWKQSGTGVSPVLSSLDGQAGRLSYSAALKQLGNVFTNSVGAEMVYIPPGEFLLGSTKEEQAWALANKVKEEEVKREGEAPRKATIKPGFWMGRTEVTVSQWKDFVAATGYKTDAEKKGYVDYSPQKGQALSRVDGLSWRDPGFGAVPQNNHPVCCISWNDAVAFCEWLTERERKAERIPASHVVRLPTEAEWEYACRAGMQTRFWWGEDKEDGKGRLNRSGEGDGFEFVAPVDSFGERGRNKFGLADMLGNIGEWCLDGYDAKEAHEECYMGNPSAAVLRGGGFWSDVSGCRCATRTSNRRSSAGSTRGFRVCVGADVTSSAGSTPSTSPAAGMQEGGILARAETRVSALTTTPKVGEVFTLPLGSNVTMELMGIPPGEFMLGSTKEEQAWAVANGGQAERVKCEGAAPRKTVIEQGCWMGRTEVTVGQWKQFVKETGYVTDGEKNGESYVFQGPGKLNVGMKGKSWRDPNFGFEPRDDHPVCCVSWNDAKAFCKWLEGREQQAGRLPHGFAVRLPTEAEWEYACRAGQQTKFWWGDASVDGRGRLNWVGKDDGFEFTAPVDSFGTRGRNGFGLADMLGNVWEWCLDEYDAAQAHEELWTGKPGRRVARGGSLIGGGSDVRCATRANSAPTYSSSGLGFRVCVGVDVAGSAGSAAQSRTGVSPVSSSLDGQAGRLSYSAALKQLGNVFTNSVGAEMVYIPPGEFLLGSTKEEQAWAVQNGAIEDNVKREGEAPRKATIKQGFWMGRTEVTVGQWKQFVKETGYVTDGEKNGESYVPVPGKPSALMKGKSWRDPNFGFELQDNHPACCIGWNDAKAFCEWLTERERKVGRLAQSYAVRLPTEAEWEYACRAGTQTKFWWGDSKEDGKGRLSWSGKGDGFESVAPVESFGEQGRNRFGLADMLGNVWEWCLDESDSTQAHEDVWTGNSGSQVIRGGSFTDVFSDCRCASRRGNHPSILHHRHGFRVCVGVAR